MKEHTKCFWRAVVMGFRGIFSGVNEVEMIQLEQMNIQVESRLNFKAAYITDY